MSLLGWATKHCPVLSIRNTTTPATPTVLFLSFHTLYIVGMPHHRIPSHLLPSHPLRPDHRPLDIPAFWKITSSILAAAKREGGADPSFLGMPTTWKRDEYFSCAPSIRHASAPCGDGGGVFEYEIAQAAAALQLAYPCRAAVNPQPWVGTAGAKADGPPVRCWALGLGPASRNDRSAPYQTGGFSCHLYSAPRIPDIAHSSE